MLVSYHVILIAIWTILWEKLKNNQPIDAMSSKQRDNKQSQAQQAAPCPMLVNITLGAWVVGCTHRPLRGEEIPWSAEILDPQMMGRGFNGQTVRTNGPRASCKVNGTEKVNGHLPTSVNQKKQFSQLPWPINTTLIRGHLDQKTKRQMGKVLFTHDDENNTRSLWLTIQTYP